MQVVATNKKAYHNFHILEKLEAGIALKGDEIKSIRAGKATLDAAFVKILANEKQNPEAYLVNMVLSAAKEPDRTRKLLLHKKEIVALLTKTAQKRLTIIPLTLYLKRGKAKVEIAVARGKKLHDKREELKRRDLEREAQRALKEF